MSLRISLPAAAAATLLLILCDLGVSQQEGAGARRLWEIEIIADTTGEQVKASAGNGLRPVYRVKAASAMPGKLKETESFVGVTVWRLRPARPNDQVTLSSITESDQWTPERIDPDNTPLRDGDRMRLSIEAPWDGYLYVLNREQYADGSTSDPYLIFPAAGSGGEDNSVAAGKVTEIPAQTDQVPYFRLDSQRVGRESVQTAEVVSVIMAPTLLPELEGVTTAISGPVRLPADKVAQWEDQWGVEAEALVLVGGVGNPWTKAEREAGMGARLLVKEEPFPQNIFRVPRRLEAPVMIELTLLIE